MIPAWTTGSIPDWVADVIIADMAAHGGSWRCSAWVSGVPDSDDSDPVAIHTLHWLAPHDVAASMAWCAENQDVDSDRDNTPITADEDRLPPGFGADVWASAKFRELVCVALRAHGLHALSTDLGTDSHAIDCWRREVGS